MSDTERDDPVGHALRLLRADYDAAGSPYGEDYPGFAKWVIERTQHGQRRADAPPPARQMPTASQRRGPR